ncbi:hypothetical protein PISL3812_07884 [Talaromyces islandicus]|uniref:Uncharacterized protein n=1 Tax=Talaromyces islandicus TaxID=28573 RepID=A0A0U1M5E4_TALIS|nr:hypothetical protein PISL3812_07884 [Talaromyces islandicus]
MITPTVSPQYRSSVVYVLPFYIRSRSMGTSANQELFSDTSVAELDGVYEQEQLWFDLNKVVNHWWDEIGGVNGDGWISNEQYDDAVRKAAELKPLLWLLQKEMRRILAFWRKSGCLEIFNEILLAF